PINSALRIPKLDHDVLALDPPQLVQPLSERLEGTGVGGSGRPGGEIANPVNLPRRLRLDAGWRGEHSPTYRTEESSSVHASRVAAHCAGGMVLQGIELCQPGEGRWTKGLHQPPHEQRMS